MSEPPRILSLKDATTPAAKQLRLEQLRAEREKYEALFAVQVRGARLPHSEAQYEFAKDHGRKYRFDRAWVSDRVAVEIQGGIYSGGAHARGAGITRDCAKLSLAAILGWRVLPVTGDQVVSGMALQWVIRALLRDE